MLNFGKGEKGIDFSEGLTLLFIGLKLADYIDWSWFLVILPALLVFLGDVLIEAAKKVARGIEAKKWAPRK